jgi:hypothetical protein
MLLTVLPVLMGAVAYVGLHHLWLWLGRRDETLHLWTAGWCLNTLLYVGGNLGQASWTTASEVVLGARLVYGAAPALIVLVLGLAHGLVGRPAPRGLLGAALAMSAILLAAVWLTPLVVSGEVAVRRDPLGRPYASAVAGPLAIVLVPCIAAVFAYVARLLWRATALHPDERQAVLVALALYTLAGVHDVLHSARVIHSVRVFHFAFVAVAVGLTYLLARRHNRLDAHLEAEVAGRTHELTEIAAANERLYAAEGVARRQAEAALAQVKQLEGMLPICAWCRRVRDDTDWQDIESYLSRRTDAVFSHGICPDCQAKLDGR